MTEQPEPTPPVNTNETRLIFEASATVTPANQNAPEGEPE